MRDADKIQETIDALNKHSHGGVIGIDIDDVWKELGEHYTLAEIEYQDGEVKRLTTRGLPLKVFFNKLTGEIKFFPAEKYESKPR